jgi:hypothetical protein
MGLKLRELRFGIKAYCFRSVETLWFLGSVYSCIRLARHFLSETLGVNAIVSIHNPNSALSGKFVCPFV